MSLHDDIMRLSPDPVTGIGEKLETVIAFKHGAKCIRHAAADLALAKDAEVDALRAEVERLRAALKDVVDCDWAFLGQDASTAEPSSLYNRVRRGRIALASAPVLGAGGEPG